MALEWREARSAIALDVGERTAISRSALYRENVDAVARWVSHLVGPSADREDLVHEVFLVACRRLPDFRGESKITTWLYGITRNVVRRHRRKMRLLRFFVGGDDRWAEQIGADQPTAAEEIER